MCTLTDGRSTSQDGSNISDGVNKPAFRLFRPARGDKKAIVMVSIGSRPWRDAAAETFLRYAKRCDAWFYLETEAPADLGLPELSDAFGRPNKIAYASKSYFAWKYLGRYSRVLVVDDTCCVRPMAPNVFDFVPHGQCGATRTSSVHAAKSFRDIKRYIRENGLPEIVYDDASYVSSAVMLYDLAIRDALSPARICRAAQLLYSTYPHQTLSYYLLQSSGCTMHLLPKVFNSLPGGHLSTEQRRQLKDVRPYISTNTYIYHVTGGYRYRERIVKDISREFLEDECLCQSGVHSMRSRHRNDLPM